MEIKSTGTPDISAINHDRYGLWNFSQDYCISCGLCSSTCPVSGIDSFDPRKIVRMVSIGLEKDLTESRWPWICTMCGKCENVCPMEVKLTEIIREIRSMRDRNEVPGILHKGLEAAVETGNNLRLPEDDYKFILTDVAEELAQEPGFESFKIPINNKQANLLVTIHNKLMNTQTDDLKHWWKIFFAAKEDWTVPSINWEGTNWGLFTGDDESMKIMVSRIIDHMDELEITNLMWPE